MNLYPAIYASYHVNLVAIGYVVLREDFFKVQTKFHNNDIPWTKMWPLIHLNKISFTKYVMNIIPMLK